jgi:uncharacterized protein DUF4157
MAVPTERQRRDQLPQAVRSPHRTGSVRAVIGRTDSRHEREAERVADDVMRRSAPVRGPGAPDAPLRVSRSPAPGGRPLDASVREVMEPRFGHDFRHVRVHADSQAAELAQGINARAFTVGQRVFFDSGQYAPETMRGDRLLAHELAHVVQHDRGLVAPGRVQRQPKESFARTGDIVRRPLAMTGAVLPWPGISISWTHSDNDADSPVPSVTIIANLQLFGPGADDAVAEAMKREIEIFWTTSFANGSHVHTTVHVSRRADDAPPDPEAVQVRVVTEAIRSFVTLDPGRVEMTYSVLSEAGVASHEFAHLLGLEDRYRDTLWAHASYLSWGLIAGSSVSDPGYEENVMGAGGGVLESKNIRDLLILHGSGGK